MYFSLVHNLFEISFFECARSIQYKEEKLQAFVYESYFVGICKRWVKFYHSFFNVKVLMESQENRKQVLK